MKPIVHRVAGGPGWFGPAWCDSSLYVEDDRATMNWPSVTCKRCIRVGGETARAEIGAARAEARAAKQQSSKEHGNG